MQIDVIEPNDLVDGLRKNGRRRTPEIEAAIKEARKHPVRITFDSPKDASRLVNSIRASKWNQRTKRGANSNLLGLTASQRGASVFLFTSEQREASNG